MVGTVSPARIQASVDLPEPLSPWISTPSPWWTVKLISRKAVDSQGVPLPYWWPTPLTSSTAGPSGSVPVDTIGTGAVATISMLSLAPSSRTTRSAESASSL